MISTLSPYMPDAALAPAPAGRAAAMRWAERVQRGAHPLVYPAIRALRHRGPVVRVPGIGVVVSDAATARAVLLDSEHFSKVGPGAPAGLWPPVLGPSVLVGMAGAGGARAPRAGSPGRTACSPPRRAPGRACEA